MSSDQFLRSPAFVRWLGAGAVLIVLLGVIRIATHDNSTSSSDSGQPAGGIPTPTSTPRPHHHHHGTAPTTAPTPTAASSTVAGRPHHHASNGSTPTTSAAQPSTGAGGGARSSTPTSRPTHTSTSGSGGSSLVIPEFGSYPYATSGSQALLGKTYPYPSHTKVKLAQDGNCVSSTWKPTSNHEEVQVVCPKGSNAVRLKSESQTIFGQSQTLDCGSNAFVYSSLIKVGDAWRFTCSGSGTTAKQQARAVGFQTFSIGGKSVKALHVHVASTISGNAAGTSTVDYWYAPSLGMLVKQVEQIKASRSGLTYRSHSSLTLTSTTPN